MRIAILVIKGDSSVTKLNSQNIFSQNFTYVDIHLQTISCFKNKFVNVPLTKIPKI